MADTFDPAKRAQELLERADRRHIPKYADTVQAAGVYAALDFSQAIRELADAVAQRDNPERKV